MRTTLLTIISGMLLAAFASSAPGRAVELDGYAAIVNQRVITIGEVMAMIQPVRVQLMDLYQGEELEKRIEDAYKTGLDALIERALILEDFAKQGGEVPERLVEDQINNIISEKFGNNRAEFLQALAEERMTLDEWREETKNRVIVSLMRRREVHDRIAISPRALRDVYETNEKHYLTPEQVKVRVIVLNQGSSEQEKVVKRKEADQLRARLAAGEDFADLAKSSSEGHKAAQGGDLGWLAPNDLRSELSEAVASLRPDEISEVIPIGEEYYIVKLDARKPASIVPFDEVRSQIEQSLRKEEEDRLYKAWISRLRKRYHVMVFESGRGGSDSSGETISTF